MISQWTNNWAKIQVDLIPHLFEEIGSTNNFAKSLPYNRKNQIVIANLQTEGRGRGTNSWSSPKSGSALMCSWIFDIHFNPQPILAPLVGLSIVEALQEIHGFSNVSLKAPNDIYMEAKKVCGILIENQTQGQNVRVIIGVGMNVFAAPDLDTASYIQNFRNQDIDECVWGGFLIEFYQKLKESVELSKSQNIPEKTAQKILISLNQNKLLKEKYTEVLSNCTLKTSTKTLNWFDL